MTTSPIQPSARFTFIDALRGLAALWVAGHHFYPGVSNHYEAQSFFEPFPTLLSFGNCGVDVFFVLSGFVIAYTVRHAQITFGYFRNFMLRRSIRLEPPYWVTILLAIAAIHISNYVRTDRVAPSPTWPQLLAHLVYLQDVLHLGNILTIFWTLCYEVQFYVTFIVLLGLTQHLGDRWQLGPEGRRRLQLLGLAPLTAWSVAIQCSLLSCPHGLMVKSWCLFLLGVFAWWALSGQIRSAHFWGYVLLLLGVLAFHPSPHTAVGLITGISIFVVGRLNRLEKWLAQAPLQYLGRISYSLYLIHTVIGDPIVYYFRQRLVGTVPSPPVAFAFFAVACAVSLVGAHLLYRFVEKPSIELAKRLKTKEKPLAASPA